MKQLLLFTVLHSVALMNLHAQDNRAARLEAFIQKTLNTVEIVPGMSIAITQGDKTVFAKGFGYANLETKTKADADTRFYIASCTKSFNGLLANILEQEGKLDLQKQITDYKPFKDFSRKEIFQNITVMDLLSHQSGIDNDYLSFRLAYTGEYTQKEILRLIEEESQTLEEGKAFEYTNFGYYLLDHIIQAELGKHWQDLLKSDVFTPLGMQHATAYISNVDKKELAYPHLGVFPDKVKPSYLMKTDATMHAAGGLVLSASDAARYLRFFTQKGKLDGKQVYPAQVVENALKQQVEAGHRYGRPFDAYGYASGWRLGKFQGDKEVVYHYGGYTGFFSHLSFLPEQELGIAVFVNHEVGMPLGTLIASYAYDLYLGNEKALDAHEKMLSKQFPQQLTKQQKKRQEHLDKLEARTWNLTLPKKAYAGEFLNDKMGKARISYQGEELIVRMGNLMAKGTPFPKENYVRVELVPGRGYVIVFDVENGAVKKVSYQGEIFHKM